MPNIKTETTDLSQTSGQWISDAPTTPTAPPVAAPASVDPITAEVVAALADWPVVHETNTSARDTTATELTGDNSATVTTFTTTDIGNSVLINDSVEV